MNHRSDRAQSHFQFVSFTGNSLVREDRWISRKQNFLKWMIQFGKILSKYGLISNTQKHNNSKEREKNDHEATEKQVFQQRNTFGCCLCYFDGKLRQHRIQMVLNVSIHHASYIHHLKCICLDCIVLYCIYFKWYALNRQRSTHTWTNVKRTFNTKKETNSSSDIITIYDHKR